MIKTQGLLSASSIILKHKALERTWNNGKIFSRKLLEGDLSLIYPKLTVIWSPKAIYNMILMIVTTSAITTTQYKPLLACCDYPSVAQCHQTPACDRAYGLCQQHYSSKEYKNHSSTLLCTLGNGFGQDTASAQLESFKDEACFSTKHLIKVIMEHILNEIFRIMKIL